MSKERNEIEAALANTVEDWKRALLVAARGSGKRDRWILGFAAASFVLALVVGVAGLIVALLK